MRKTVRSLRYLLPVAFLFLAACGGTPPDAEKARGVLGGVNAVLALSVLFVVGAVAIIGAALVVDRAVRTRKLLKDAPEPEVSEEEEEGPEVVAGIGVGRAPVPRWLYGAYVLIPVFALAYVFSNVAVAPATATKTPAPTPSGPCTTCTIAAQQIKFTSDKLEVAAGKSVTVSFENRDAGVPHTFTVWKSKADAGKGAPIADTGPFSSGSKDAKFAAPAAGGSLFFDCTVHPTSMFGTIEAK